MTTQSRIMELVAQLDNDALVNSTLGSILENHLRDLLRKTQFIADRQLQLNAVMRQGDEANAGYIEAERKQIRKVAAEVKTALPEFPELIPLGAGLYIDAVITPHFDQHKFTLIRHVAGGHFIGVLLSTLNLPLIGKIVTALPESLRRQLAMIGIAGGTLYAHIDTSSMEITQEVFEALEGLVEVQNEALTVVVANTACQHISNVSFIGMPVMLTEPLTDTRNHNRQHEYFVRRTLENYYPDKTFFDFPGLSNEPEFQLHFLREMFRELVWRQASAFGVEQAIEWLDDINELLPDDEGEPLSPRQSCMNGFKGGFSALFAQRMYESELFSLPFLLSNEPAPYRRPVDERHITLLVDELMEQFQDENKKGLVK